MTEGRDAMTRLFAACWADESLKARFIADPRAVLAEFDMPVPDGIDVKVVENADDCVHITLPSAPASSDEVTDGELASAAGGHTWPPWECTVGTCPKAKGGTC